MARFLLMPALFLGILVAGAGAQDTNAVKPAPGAVAASLGLRLGIVPDLLYEQLPHLKRGEGVVVEQVETSSAAARAGLRRHDLLLTYGGQPIQNPDHFHQLIRAAAPDQSRPLVLLRGGRETTLQVALPPALALPVPVIGSSPKGMIKAGGPPAVNVEAQRLEGGKLQITFTYYSQGTGKLEKLKCSGSLADIENEVRQLGKQNQMPSRVQDLVEVALRRIRTLKLPGQGLDAGCPRSRVASGSMNAPQRSAGRSSESLACKTSTCPNPAEMRGAYRP